jgi:hypothetical protein
MALHVIMNEDRQFEIQTVVLHVPGVLSRRPQQYAKIRLPHKHAEEDAP